MIDPISVVTKFAASIAPKGWLVIGAVVLLISAVTAVVLIADNRDKRMVETASESGASKAVSEGQAVTLEQVGKANEAEQEIERGGDSAVAGCMSDARGDSTGCERFAN